MISTLGRRSTVMMMVMINGGEDLGGMCSICVASTVLLVSAKVQGQWWSDGLRGCWCSYRRPGSKEMSCKPTLTSRDVI